jgi:hypothetical protein
MSLCLVVYFITEVSHNITSLVHLKQHSRELDKVFIKPPSTDTYLTSINENLLTKIESNFAKSIVNQKDEEATPTNNTQTQGSKQTNSSNCGKYLYEDYIEYAQTTEELIVYSSATQIHTVINSIVPDKKMADYIYLISYLASYEKDGFKANHNNFGNVWLTYYRGDIESYNSDEKLFYCATSNENDKIKTPFAIFKSFELYVKFMQSCFDWFHSSFSNLEGSNEDNFIRFYIIDWLYEAEYRW